ncbi:hypothetical protein [Nocardia vulneris]|uniref:hypothetical protein n=1 Tax=Nocardia vulneris TaxID=1141657 RepID=UPI0005BD370D|nr:hypothetical protein [Nocardia vulneris]
MSEQQVLVTGATGNTGSRVAAGLRQLGVPVRAGSRGGSTPFDWYEPASWPAALDGVDAVYLATPMTFGVRAGETARPVGFAADAVADFVTTAVAHGVTRLVLLAGRSARAEPVNPFMVELERPVRESGVEWTVLSPSVFAQNFRTGPLRDGIIAGRVEFVAVSDQVVVDFVDVTDIADAAVRVLTTAGHGGRTYELSGPRALSEQDAVAVIGRTLDRAIVAHRIDLDEALAANRAAGFTDDSITLMDLAVRGRASRAYSVPFDGIQHLLGRAPRSFEEFARAAAASGVWDRPDPRLRA